MIKYLGSKRLLVPVLGRIAERRRGAHRGRPVHRHDPRGAGVQAAGPARSPPSTSRRTPRCSRDCYVATDGRRRRPRPAGRGARPAQRRCAGAAATSPRRSASDARYFQPRERRRIDADPRRDRASTTRPAAAGAADQPAPGRRPGRLHHRPADGLPQAVGAAGCAPADPASRRRSSRPGHGSARRRDDARRRAARDGPGLPRPALQPAPVLHELPRLGDARPLGRARALRHRLQARSTPATRPPRACSTTGGTMPAALRCGDRARPRRGRGRRRTTTRAGCARRRSPPRCDEAGHERVEALGFDSKRYVGAQIGIHNLRGERVGEVSHLRNTEFLFVAGPTEKVEAAVAAAGHHESVAS